MSGFTCPFCASVMAVDSSTCASRFPSFESTNGIPQVMGENSYKNSCIRLDFYKCPSCGEYSVMAKGMGSSVKSVSTIIRPNSLAKQYPNHVPESIRKDYEEACSIVKLSPKASATLLRRCLQGMIRDFWNITGKDTLKQEIDAIEEMVHPEQWKVIQAIRQLGNIGAHMEDNVNLLIDIDAGEAENLIKLVELLIHDWYIRRHEQQQLYADILKANDTKQAKRSLKE